MGLAGCDERRPQPLTIDNALTADEIAAGRLTPEVMWKMSRAGGSSLSPDGRTLLYQQTDYSISENRGVTTLWTLDMESKRTTRLTDTSSNNLSAQWNADGSAIYFLSDRSGTMQVWRMNASGGDATRITGDGDGEGVPDVEGFGVSPDERHIWWVQTVHVAARKSSDLYEDMPRSKARIYDDLMARHWDYWDEGDYRHIFVGELGAGTVTGGTDIIGPDAPWDAPLAPYFDMAEIAWNHAGTMLAYTCKPLTGTAYAVSTDSDIFVYSLESGATQNICKPVGIESKRHDMPGYDKYPVWSPDDRYIAFRSMRRAGNESDKERLFVYDCRTALMRDLTCGFDYNAANVVWEDGRTLLFIAPIEATHQICRVQLPAENATCGTIDVEVLTSGDHDINAFTAAAGRIAAEVCTISMATEFFEADPADGSLTQLSQINRAVYDAVKMGQVQKRWVETTDGKQMLTWVILPPDFDPSEKYPVLLYCQGGPQSVVSQFWSYRWNFQIMAANGYVVIAPNRHGLPGFGTEWNEQVSGDWTGQCMDDYISAIDDAANNLPFVDRERLGAVGASFGGFSVYYLAGHHDKRFKCFIAHDGAFNLESMYTDTEEAWFSNWEYEDAYWNKPLTANAKKTYDNSPHKFVDRWDTPILCIHGEKDYRINANQGFGAFNAARMRGIPAELLIFPDENHWVLKPQNGILWQRTFFGWLDRWLKK